MKFYDGDVDVGLLAVNWLCDGFYSSNMIEFNTIAHFYPWAT